MGISDSESEPNSSNYKIAVKELRKKEVELGERTKALEDMMRAITNLLSDVRGSSSNVNGPPPTFHDQSASCSLPQSSTPGTGTSFSYASTYPKSYLRDALELVPKYDGHNIPVWQFARACKRAKESIPLVDEASFVCMLRNKLTHHAYLAVEDETHPTVEKFLDCLKRVFGPGKSSNYYRGQLSMAYKKQNEHILDYIARIKDLKAAIIEGDQNTLGRTLSELELTSIESFALEAFYEGLPREYRIELRAEGYSNFADACSKILVINRRLEREDSRYKNLRTSRNDPSSPFPPTRILQRGSPAFSNNAPVSSEPAGRKICSYCKNIGHLIHECRKRQYRESFGNAVDNNNNTSSNNANNNDNSNNNNNDRNNFSLPKPGNSAGASANGTPRGSWNTRPLYPIESTPGPSTSFEETMEPFQSLNLNPRPSTVHPHSCSTPEHNPTS